MSKEEVVRYPSQNHCWSAHLRVYEDQDSQQGRKDEEQQGESHHWGDCRDQVCQHCIVKSFNQLMAVMVYNTFRLKGWPSISKCTSCW